MTSNNQQSEQGEPIFDKVVLLFKEFEIFPKIISASHLYLIYSEIANAKTDNFFSWTD